jgi:uncharacterized membrane protein YesL
MRLAILAESVVQTRGRTDWPYDRMSLLDLIKATVVCGGVAFLFYSFPILGQIITITILTLLWLSYARKTLIRIRSRRLA